MQTYLFYDIETTGLNKAFDQILHFAAIRTDLALKELDRHEIKIQLNPDVIPSPHAILTHKMGIKQISSGTAEFAAIKQIHQWINTSNTISLGYNTLGFDDEFLRFSFYRNLLKPYTHQYANQCYRMDIYPMAIMFFLFKNNVLNWPIIDNKISLKLENINALNQFILQRSHHAMVDVEVTLELARRFLTERSMWEYLHGYFKKEVEQQRLQQLENNIALLVNGKLGHRTSYQCPVLLLGKHQHYTNQTIWLRLDKEELMQTTIDSIPHTTWSIAKKPGEPNFILPYKERFLTHLAPERMQLAEENLTWLQKNSALQQQIITYHTQYKHPLFPHADVATHLYMNGFWSNEDEFFCQRFHAMNDVEKINFTTTAANNSLKMLALRILGRQGFETKEFIDYMQKVNPAKEEDTLIDYQGKKRLTPTAALQEIQHLRNETSLDGNDLELLTDLETYLQQKFF